MKRVTPQPILPREMGENWRLEALRLLREYSDCLLYKSDAADERSWVDLGGCRIIKNKHPPPPPSPPPISHCRSAYYSPPRLFHNPLQ